MSEPPRPRPRPQPQYQPQPYGQQQGGYPNANPYPQPQPSGGYPPQPPGNYPPQGYGPGGYGPPPGYEIRKKKRFYKRWWFWLLVVPAIIVVVVVIIVLAAAGSAVNHAVNDSHSVVETVTGTGRETTADIMYDTEDGSGNSSSHSQDNVKLPYTKKFTIKGDFSGFNIEANTTEKNLLGNKKGTLSCQITVDGKVVSTDKAQSAVNGVDCDGSGFSGS